MDQVPWWPAVYYDWTDSGLNESIPGITGPQARSHDRIGIPGWVPITEALAIERAGVIPVEIYYRCLGASVL